MTRLPFAFLLPALAVTLASGVYAAPLAVPTLPDATAPADASYVLSPDDQIDISALGHEELRAGVTILPDGSFNYPILGKVHAAGLTIDGLTRTLVKGLSSQYNQPEVTVYLRQSRPRKVLVLGDGSKGPGQFEFRSGMHLSELLAASGGPATEPQLVKATLVTANGAQSVSIDLTTLLNGTDASQNLPLAPGDILFLTQRNPEVAQVQVVGDVAKPGAYSIMPDGISILALLNNAGGALPTAKLTEAQIMHGGVVQVVNLRPLLTTDLNSPAGRIRILPGDTLLVPDNKNRILALGQVRTPGVLGIPDDQPLTLTTAYALVGGATDDGDKKNVDIVRRLPTGKPMLLAFNMEDLLKGKNDVSDITLQPNDILFIQTRNHPKSISDILGSLGSASFLISAAKVVGL